MKERNIEDYSVLSYIECPICNKKNIDYIRLQSHLKKNHKINVLQDYNFEISETSIDDDEKTLNWFFKINLIDTNNYKDINKFDISKDFELFVEKQTDGYLHINKYFNITENDNYYLNWDNLFFSQNLITLNISGKNYSFIYKGINSNFNIIKEFYFKTKHESILHFKIKNNKIDLLNSNGYLQIKSLIENYQSESKIIFDFVDKINFDVISLNKSQFIEYINSHKKREKTKFIEILSSYQSTKHNLIVLFEKNNQKEENTVIFRVLTKHSQELIIWENFEDSRASHIFIENRNIKTILNYIITDNLNYKRKRLWLNTIDSKKLKLKLNYLGHIKHIDQSSYIKKLEEFISKKH